MSKERLHTEQADCLMCSGTGDCYLCESSGQRIEYQGNEAIFTNDPCTHCSPQYGGIKLGSCRTCGGFGKHQPAIALGETAIRFIERTPSDLEMER